MIAWPIEAALKSNCFEHVLVSTDDAEIAEIAKNCGAEVPFLRPANLADDFTHAHKAAKHMLEWALSKLGKYEYFAHIYPTAPMLTVQDIQKGYELVLSGKNFAYTAQKISFPIYQVVIEEKCGNIKSLFPPEKINMRSQDMPNAYIDAGQLYFFNVSAFLKEELNIKDNVSLITIPSERAIDIDTEDDWLLAEKLAELQGLK